MPVYTRRLVLNESTSFSPESLILALLIVFAVAAAVKLIRRLRKKDITKMYQPREILTDREYGFYKKLRRIAEKNKLQVFTKVRLADLVEPKSCGDKSLWWECFNKIKAKHIDFALADYDTNIVLLVELDDSTHARTDRRERDIFVDAVLKNTGYTLIRTYGETDVISEALSR